MWSLGKNRSKPRARVAQSSPRTVGLATAGPPRRQVPRPLDFAGAIDGMQTQLSTASGNRESMRSEVHSLAGAGAWTATTGMRVCKRIRRPPGRALASCFDSGRRRACESGRSHQCPITTGRSPHCSRYFPLFRMSSSTGRWAIGLPCRSSQRRHQDPTAILTRTPKCRIRRPFHPKPRSTRSPPVYSPIDPRDLTTLPRTLRPAGFSERRHRRVQIERSSLARHLVRDDQHHQPHC